MKIKIILLLPVLVYSFGCKNVKKTDWPGLIEENIDFAVDQYLGMENTLPDSLMPRSFEDGKLVTSGTGWWCSGFYPGTLWYLYEYTGNEKLKEIAARRTMLIEKEKFNTGTHDLGFMLYCSFGNGYRLTGNEVFAGILRKGSESLMTRYNEVTGCIKSWDNNRWQFPVIIDNMMNLEFLFWTTENGGDPGIYEKILSHSDHTIRNHYRPDFSSFHLVDYDTITGEVLLKQTVQGYSDESAWARGQSWGLYGFTTVYRATQDEKYLDHACNVADFLLNHPNMPKDMIPYWDYNAPDIPDAPRDVSAGAIMASALVELSGYCDGVRASRYLEAAQTMIHSMATHYRATGKGENGNFILNSSVGHLKQNSEVNVPLSYADYYFIEALMRLRSVVGFR